MIILGALRVFFLLQDETRRCNYKIIQNWKKCTIITYHTKANGRKEFNFQICLTEWLLMLFYGRSVWVHR